MSSLAADIRKLMKRYGFKLLRQNKHYYWGNGKVELMTSVSPSDRFAIKKIEAQLRRLVKAGQALEV